MPTPTQIKLDKLSLYKSLNEILIQFTQDTGLEITDIDLNTFIKDEEVITYNPKVRVRL